MSVSNFQCAVKCVLGRSHLLDDKNKVSRATLQKFMDTRVPELYHELGHDVAEHCYLEDFGEKIHIILIRPPPNFIFVGEGVDDENCSPYGKFGECMQHVMME